MKLSSSSKFAFAPLMPVAKVGFSLPGLSSAPAYRQPGFVEKSVPRRSAADLKHTFVVKPLKRRGVFKPRTHAYLCLRCRYAFLVSERRGLIVAVDRKAQPLPDPENSRRLATFAQGPCPAPKSADQRRRREPVEVPKLKLSLSPSGILALIARIGAKMRYPYFVEFNVHTPDGITPQDLLS